MDIPDRPNPSVYKLYRNIVVAIFRHDHEFSLPSLIKSLVQLCNISRKQRPMDGKTKRKRKATKMTQKMSSNKRPIEDDGKTKRKRKATEMSQKMKSNLQLDSLLPAYRQSGSSSPCLWTSYNIQLPNDCLIASYYILEYCKFTMGICHWNSY